MKKIYVIRHCEAEGQLPEAKLTERGVKQAEVLADLFFDKQIDRIISSPFKRAVQSIEPLANRLNLEIELNNLLTERVLSTMNLPDWFEKLRETFDDYDLKFKGGESSREAANRIISVIDDVINSVVENTIIVTHGGLTSLLLNHFDKSFGFEGWQNLSNPDVFLLTVESEKITYKRLWK